ncbi:MAG: PhoU domain-containing protein [Nanoarchaeota archaeon]|nr:hypothetical protein [Nanoarchaeota archaeon]
MKRKIIQLAGKTLVVSLPIKWVKEKGVKKGDEINLLETKTGLLIETKENEGKEEIEEIEVDIAQHEELLNRYVGALYKAGYDKIKIFFKNKKQLEIIDQTIKKSCIGFEIIEETNNSILIERLSKAQADEFEKVQRRLFLFLLGVAQDSLEAIIKQDYEELEKIIKRDDNINRFSDFCRRIINKKLYTGKMKTAPLYHIFVQLEKLGDYYREICRTFLKHKEQINPNITETYKMVNEYVRLFYELFYSFNLEKLTLFKENKTAINKEIEIICEKKSQIKILFLLQIILETTFEMTSSLLVSQI